VVEQDWTESRKVWREEEDDENEDEDDVSHRRFSGLIPAPSLSCFSLFLNFDGERRNLMRRIS
jgi:hypothetical protein